MRYCVLANFDHV